MSKKYEFLVVASNGKPSAYKLKPVIWGTSETSPFFSYADFKGTEEEADYIIDNCFWDGANWRHNVTNEIFASDMIIPLCKEFTKGTCSAPPPPHQVDWDIQIVRMYWFRKFFPYRKEPHVKQFLQAIIQACWEEIREAISKIDQKTIIEATDGEDRRWLQEDWKVINVNN
jgi:hypothetical protein